MIVYARVAAALALSVSGARAQPSAEGRASFSEPSLQAVEEAAMRVAAGMPEADASRLSRARAAHWAPQLRAQLGLRDDLRFRRGQLRLAPLLEDDSGESRTFTVVAVWDLAQVVYARDETQLALAHVHLARVRRQVAEEAARLYDERLRHRLALSTAGAEERTGHLLALFQATARLDVLTAGLYRAALDVLQGEVFSLEALEPGAVRPRPQDPGPPHIARPEEE